MTRIPRPASPSRRSVLLGISAVPAAWVLAPLAARADDTPGLVTTPQRARVQQPECLADLINSGVVKRADLVAR